MQNAVVAPEFDQKQMQLTTVDDAKVESKKKEVPNNSTSPVEEPLKITATISPMNEPPPIDEYEDYMTEKFCCCGLMLREGVGFFYASFARSPTVILAALVGPLTLQLAETDAFCQTNPASGLSTGTDGIRCFSNGEFGTNVWNDTLWRQFNGTECITSDSMVGEAGILKYDIGIANSNAKCASALSAYRTSTGFTCNCTGDYAFLDSGARPGTVLTFSATIYYLVMVFVAPVVGALADVTPHRKRLWAIFATIYTISVGMMCVLGQESLWIVSLFFATCAGPSYDIMCVPIMAYLPEIHHKEVIRAKYAGIAQAANYLAQFLFGILMSFLTVALYDSIGSIGVAQVSCVICSGWITWFTIQSFKRMDARPAGHAHGPNQSMFGAAFGSIVTTSKLLYNDYPVAARYLLTNLFGATGIIVNIALLTTYLVVQMQMGGAQIVIVYLLVMTSGAPSAACYGTCNKYFGAKPMYIFLMLFACVCNGTLPFLINRPDQVLAVYAFAPICGAYFGLFFAMQSLIFSNFIPVGEEAVCYGLQAFSSSVVRWIPPLVYSAIVQATNDHRLALIHICIFYLAAAISMVFVDFEKGKADVAKTGRSRSGSRSPRESEDLPEADAIQLVRIGEK